MAFVTFGAMYLPGVSQNPRESASISSPKSGRSHTEISSITPVMLLCDMNACPTRRVSAGMLVPAAMIAWFFSVLPNQTCNVLDGAWNVIVTNTHCPIVMETLIDPTDCDPTTRFPVVSITQKMVPVAADPVERIQLLLVLIIPTYSHAEIEIDDVVPGAIRKFCALEIDPVPFNFTALPLIPATNVIVPFATPLFPAPDVSVNVLSSVHFKMSPTFTLFATGAFL